MSERVAMSNYFSSTAGAPDSSQKERSTALLSLAGISLQLLALFALLAGRPAGASIFSFHYNDLSQLAFVLIAASIVTAVYVLLEPRLNFSKPSQAANSLAHASPLARIAGSLDALLTTSIEVIQSTLNISKKQKDLIDKIDTTLRNPGPDFQALIKENAVIKATAEQLDIRLKKAQAEAKGLRTELDVIRAESYTDELSNLKNRKWFDRRIVDEIDIANQKASPFCLAMLDLDNFKRINDEFGHQSGDRIIRWVGESLTNNLKGRDTAARYGGEEFSVLMPNTKLADAKSVLEQIRNQLASVDWTHAKSGRPIGKVTASIGVAELKHQESKEDLIERADKNLYEAKQSGKNRVIAK